MGIFLGGLKILGTVALSATGIASKVLEEASNTVGFELGSEIFSTTKNLSVDGIKGMWDNGEEDRSEALSHIDDIDEATQGVGRRKMAETARQAAQIAKKNGDMEKYEYYMEQYNNYKE